ncbi:MAG: OB-fold nucleic acid binding domain-containing protein, partial [Clostridia bacterium]|nr:OB-fold nucleic acid binding domain-containing protein [Clostridia bacterium]
KKPEIISGLRKQFVDGAIANQVDEKIAGQIFDLMEYFAGYGFNKSHSAAYALVSYQTAYLKMHYPVEFMAALLTSVRDNTDKVIVYIEECRRMGIEVLPPDINESMESFTAVGGKIRFGLAAIKNVGFAAVELIIKQREENGLYKNFGDFCFNLDTKAINKRVVENLIKAGSFASLGYGRNQLLQVLDQGLTLAQKKQKERQSGQLSLFEFWEEDEVVLEVPQVQEYSQADLLQLEKEALGLYISGHPLEEYRPALIDSKAIPIIELKDNLQVEMVTVGGIFQSIKQLNTKQGDPMAFAQLEDLTGSLEIVIFPKVFQKYQRLLKTDQPVLLEGKISFSGEEDLKIMAEKVRVLEKKGEAKKLELYIKTDALDQFGLGQVKSLLQNYSGAVPVLLYNQEKHKLFRTSQEYWVNIEGSLLTELGDLVGKANVRIKEKH